MILAAEYKTNIRYAREMMTEGVIVIMAATRKLNAEWMVEGNVDSACKSVV